MAQLDKQLKQARVQMRAPGKKFQLLPKIDLFGKKIDLRPKLAKEHIEALRERLQ